jgi:histidyl-tRNA synthetase
MKAIGGADISGIGFGIGVDRTLLACQQEKIELPNPNQVKVFVIWQGEANKSFAVSLVDRLRQNSIITDICYEEKSLKGALKAADRSGAKYAVLLGEAEMAAASVQVKDLTTSTQQDVPLDQLVEFFSQRI